MQSRYFSSDSGTYFAEGKGFQAAAYDRTFEETEKASLGGIHTKGREIFGSQKAASVKVSCLALRIYSRS